MKKWPWRALLSALTIVVFFAVVVRQGGSLDHTEFLALIAAQPAAFASLVFMAFRTKLLTGGQISVGRGLKANALTLLSAYVIPPRLADGVKPVYLRISSGLPMGKGLSVVFYERITDAACLLAMVAILILLKGFEVEGLIEMTLAVAFIFVAGVAAVMTTTIAPKWIRRNIRRIPWRNASNLFLSGFESIQEVKNEGKLLHVTMLSTATWICSYMIFSSYFHVADSGRLEEYQILTVFIFATLGLTVSILPAGLGTFEGAIALSLLPLGYSLPDALAASFMLRIACGISVVVISAWVIAVDRFDPGRLLTSHDRARSGDE